MRLRRGALQIDRAAADRECLPLPRLPAADRQRVRRQHLDRAEVCRGRPFAPPVGHAAAGSGKPHEVFRCPDCGTALWSKYHAAPGDTVLLRAGTLDHPEAVKPDVHIFTRSKLPWLELPADVPAFERFYKLAEFWPAESRERLRRNIAGED